MNEWLKILLSVGGTVIVYIAALKVYRRFHHPFTLPIFTATISIVLLLLITKIPYETYMAGGSWIEHLLGPAVVALAYPLYNQRRVLRKNLGIIFAGVMAGAVTGIFSGGYFTKWVGLEEHLIASILPKSVTTPIAMDIATTINGAPALTAVLVMIAGTGGAILSPYIYKWSRIEHSFARGIGLGSASHGIGTAKAVENSEEEGAASSVAMTLSAIIVAILIPLLYPLVI